ncbi:YhcN/YlaJ family sporulation lipoprotein [Thermosyntropha sp.]|uniref:YhcN/YlaJ family sporulation lipoprotein n=1 Tax=Thermosyntropha sp. TaxID=2740820 RepID=UPI0025F835DD|nr:YhcN/YlaJ family sporulation lipoprotein [Thermosyntropha sp.]MBO8159970.1 YhcN/YlaJ family sporulation lipoprotein [Thermosyntropha sp.]
MDRVNLTDAEAKRLAQKFANMADEVNGVQKATVVVSDQPETVTDSKTRTRVTTIKNDRTITSPGPGKTVPDRVTMRGLVVMVGLDVDRSIINNTTEMERLKARVANKILRADNRISRVYVTTKPELMKRISNMASDIVKGKPLSNMRNDLNNLMDKMKGESSAF